ncbi:MAG: hypothetical protein FJ151_04695, partial [Euryarchaeota archaeon]|nr:hypothetical protein [Euryarchaeota archaeon]
MRPESVPLGAGEARKPSIKVVGVGGAGCNAIASSSFESAAICTSIGHFKHIRTSKRFLLSEEQLLFLRDTDPRAIASIDHEWKDALVRTVGEADLIFVFTGLGGETGSFAAPAVSQICRKLSSLVITSIALPFSVEGKDRQRMAMLGLTHAFDSSDMTITYPNDCLLKMVPNLPFRKAFSIMDDIMMIPPMEMERVLTVEDLHRVRTAFSSSRHTRLGVGAATGDGR